MTRRHFLQAAAAAATPAFLHGAPNDKVIAAVVGVSRNSIGGNGRGCELALGLAGLPNVEVAYVCDVDEMHLGKAVDAVSKKSRRAPRGERDFRRILEDKSVDAVVIATPDHWHAPAAILACAAGKHVYVEKPCSHNPAEGEMLVAAARKYDRRVQHGTQRRSWPALQEAVAKLREGAIGRVLCAQSYYFNQRPSIGRGRPAPPPAGLDWDLWQGPAPVREFRDNYVHYHWHWFWHWGTGELGNNGVHVLDVCRWGLGVDYPVRAVSAGQKLRHIDDQETPDTNLVTLDFGGEKPSTIAFESRSWAGRTINDPKFDLAFYGEEGSLLINGSGYTICDPAGKELARGSGSGGNDSHLQNFADAIRGAAKLNAEIEEGHKSVLLCHLGNIAWRTQRTVHFDPATRKLADDPETAKLWGREYRPGWEPNV